MTDREHLLNLICGFTMIKGNYTLSSGETTEYYINMKNIMFIPSGIHAIASVMLDELMPLIYRFPHLQIGGRAIGAVPIVAAILHEAYNRNLPHLSGFYVREPRTYGKDSPIEGYLDQVGNIVIVDDVVTTGATVIHVYNTIEEHFDQRSPLGWNGTLHGIYSLVNRSKDPSWIFAKLFTPYIRIFDMPELLEHKKKLNESTKV